MFRNLNITLKISIILILIFIFFITIFAIFNIIKTGDLLKDAFILRGNSLVNKLSSDSSYFVSMSITIDQRKNLENELKKLSDEDDFLYAYIFDRSGKILASFDNSNQNLIEGITASTVIDTLKDRISSHAGNDPVSEIKAKENHKGGIYEFFLPVAIDLDMSAPGDVFSSGPSTARADNKIGGVVIGLSYSRVHSQLNNLIVVLIILVLVLSVLIYFIIFFFIKFILLKPMSLILSTSNKIADGNLTERVYVKSNDELGELSNMFNKMTEQLCTMISQIISSHQRMDRTTFDLDEAIKNVLYTIETQTKDIKNISHFLSDMMVSIQNIASNIQKLLMYAEDTSSSVLEMTASIDEVLDNTENLSNSVSETASSVEEMAVYFKQIANNVNVLRKFAEDTSSSMAEMEVAIKQVEIIAMDSMNLSIEVSKNSQDGMDVVQRNIDIMQDIKETVFSSVQIIERLGKRSEEIGEILTVINDVGEQTNLLALNAAIIAAQAGEHGKGFAVVADEIRDLSERTANSTKEIANLIKALQDEAANAVKSMRMGSENVEKGFEQSRLTGEALRKINESASRSTDMAKEIAKATKEQTEGSKLVTREVEKVTEMILQINRATEEQTKSSELIMRAVNDMRNLTKQVKKAMVEQSLGSKQIAKAVENVTDMTDSINKATQEQKTNSEEIQKIINTLGNSVDLNAKNINIMDNALKELKRQASMLRDAISKFKV